MNSEAYITQYHEANNAKLGNIFNQIMQGIDAGLRIFGSLGGGGGSGSGGGCSGQARGLRAIQTCSAQVLAAIDALAAQVGQQPYQQLIDQANQLVAVLSDPQYFYQAQRGDDAAALANAKSQAQQKLQQLIALANQAAQNPIGTGVGQAGQVISSGGNVVTSGFDSLSEVLNDPIVIYGGLGLIAYMLINKKR